jgi:hypothetical protein
VIGRRYRLRADVVRAAGPLTRRVSGRRALMSLGDLLAADEVLEQVTTAGSGTGSGILARTDRRLLYVRSGWTGSEVAEFDIPALTRLVWTPGVLTGGMSVAAPGREVAFRSVPLEDGALLVQAVLAVVPHAAAPAPERERPDRERRSRGDAAEQLRELVRQRDAGLLTPEEFAAERARIVARM